MRTKTLHRARRQRAGVTLLEAVLAVGVMTLAVSLFSTMVVSTSRQRVANHEYPIATEEVRVLLETMRNTAFGDVYALYNSDPDDDPGAAGSAPGHRFAVEGLDALDTSPDGLVGEIFFPTMDLTQQGGGLELREDSEDETLGMPRDLNGDSILDDEDHGLDYVILPIRVEVDWRGRYGDRHLEVYTMLAEFKK